MKIYDIRSLCGQYQCVVMFVVAIVVVLVKCAAEQFLCILVTLISKRRRQYCLLQKGNWSLKNGPLLKCFILGVSPLKEYTKLEKLLELSNAIWKFLLEYSRMP